MDEEPVSLVVKDIAVGRGGPEFDSPAGQIVQCRQRFPTAALFLRSCVAQALSDGEGPRNSLHASA